MSSKPRGYLSVTVRSVASFHV